MDAEHELRLLTVGVAEDLLKHRGSGSDNCVVRVQYYVWAVVRFANAITILDAIA